MPIRPQVSTLFPPKARQRLLIGLGTLVPAALLLAHMAQAEVAATPPAFDMPGTLVLDYSWMGLAPTVPSEHFALSAAKGMAYLVDGKHEEKHLRGTGQAKHWTVKGPVDNKYVKAVFTALGAAAWKPAKEAAQVIEHTDDYPSTSLSFASTAKQPVKLFSTSNTETGAPWNLSVGDKLYVTQSTDVGKTVYDLLDAVRALPHKP